MEKTTKGIGQDVWKQDVKPQNLILNISEEGIPANIVNSYPNGARVSAIDPNGKIKRYTVENYNLRDEDEIIEQDIAQVQQDIIQLQADVADLSPSIIEFETASLTTLAGETEDVVITNASLTASSKIFCSPAFGGTNSQGYASVVKITPASGSATLKILNIGAQANSNDFNGTLKFLLHIFVMLLFVSTSFAQKNISKIGNTIFRDSTISTGQRVFDIRTDTIGIFRNKTLFNSQTYYQRGIRFDKVSGVMDSDTLHSGSYALWLLSGDTTGKIKFDSVGGLYGYKGATNYWYISQWGALYVQGITLGGQLIFNQSGLTQNLVAQHARIDSGSNINRSISGISLYSGHKIGDIRFYKAKYFTGTPYTSGDDYIYNNNANRTLWVKEDSATVGQDSLSGFYSVKTNSWTQQNLTGSSATIPMLHSVQILRFDNGSGAYTLNADTAIANRGVAGGTITLVIYDTTASTRTITFGSFFSSSGTVTMDGNDTSVDMITFACLPNKKWYEVSRTLNLTR